jgi:homoserine O-succinyltransferase
MAISLPRHLPAKTTLEAEGLRLLSRRRSAHRPTHRHHEPVQIALLNLMPQKPVTETQIVRLLALADLSYEVELTLFVPEGYVSKTTPAAHLHSNYTPWRQLQNRPVDGLIVTGAPVEHLPFAAVSYWRQLTEIMDWARTGGIASFHICWAAQAALYHFHSVPKHGLADKMFGLFEQSVCSPDNPLLRGFGKVFKTPVSRHTEVRREDLPAHAGLEILAESAQSGLCLIDDRRNAATYMFNHLEYDACTLGAEYQRDRQAGKAIQAPRHYFTDPQGKTVPPNSWRLHGRLLFRNWLREIALRSRLDYRSELLRQYGRGIC